MTHGKESSVDGGRYGKLKESFMDHRLSLHVWGEDLGVVAEIYEERVTGPLAFNLYSFEGDVVKKVFQHQTNTNTMSFQGGNTCFLSHNLDYFEEL